MCAFVVLLAVNLAVKGVAGGRGSCFDRPAGGSAVGAECS